MVTRWFGKLTIDDVWIAAKFRFNIRAVIAQSSLSLPVDSSMSHDRKSSCLIGDEIPK